MHTMSKIAGIAAAAVTAGVLLAPTAGAMTPRTTHEPGYFYCTGGSLGCQLHGVVGGRDYPFNVYRTGPGINAVTTVTNGGPLPQPLPNGIPNTGPTTLSSTFFYSDGSSITVEGGTPLGTDGDVAIGTSTVTPEICASGNAICYKSRTPSKDGSVEK